MGKAKSFTEPRDYRGVFLYKKTVYYFTNIPSKVLFYIAYGGDEGDRTPDLLNAIQALSQLSYAPMHN